MKLLKHLKYKSLHESEFKYILSKKEIYFVLLVCIINCMVSCTQTNEIISDPKIPELSPIKGGVLKLQSRACYFADADSIEKYTEIEIDTASFREVEQINSIMEYVGLPQNFQIYRGDIDNALATIVNNQRIIIYNKDRFIQLDSMNSSYWKSLFIIAHEIGHHLADNISDTSNVLNAELDADRFAAFLLCRMGADSNQVIGAVASSLITATVASKTHPSREKRIETVKKSWKESNDLRLLSATPPPIKGSSVFSETWLIFNRYFLNKWGIKRLDIYTYRDPASDAYQFGRDYYPILEDSGSYDDPKSYLSHLPREKIQLKGIITDVVRMPNNPDLPEVSSISIMVNLTQLDPIANGGMMLNRRSNFLVFFQPLTKRDDVRDFYEFFVGGRRIDFTAVQYGSSADSNIKLNYIAKAASY